MLEAYTKTLKAAQIPKTAKRYLTETALTTAASFLGLLALVILFKTLHIPHPFESVPEVLLLIVILGIIPAGVFFFLYFYPHLTASGRKTKIDLDLPYAVTYMQALSSNLTIYQIFKNVYQASDLYGEVSKECGGIVRNVELFGLDLMEAVEDVKSTTPSEKFRELLNDILLIHKSGGSLKNFLHAKSLSYRDLAKTEMESLLQFLEIVAEVYVTAFVAAPIAVIIMVVAQNLSGQNTLGNILPLMYIGLPVGAIFLIAVLYILLPPNDITITHHEHRDAEYTDDIIISTDSTRAKKFEQKIASRRLILKIKDILRHPVKYYISHYAVSAVFGSILLAVSFILWINGTIQKIFPVFTNEVAVCIMIIALLLPVMAAYELRNRYATAIEKQFPDFLRDLADMRDIGMTLQGAMTQIAGSKTGVLSTEVSLVSREIQYGSSVSGALVRMEERIGLVTVKRAISLLVKASEITEHIREILTIAVSDMEHYLKMKHTRFNVSFVYVAIIYLSFGIFLFTAYAMNVMFIESFSTFNITFDTMQSRNQMFIIGIILASFSGIMAGQLSANSILAGCKHSIIMLIMTVVTFIYLI